MSGCDRDELIETSFPDYFTDSKQATVGVRTTLDKGAVTNYELTLMTKDGREMLVSFNAAIFKDEDGKIRGIFASARDITEQKKLQDKPLGGAGLQPRPHRGLGRPMRPRSGSAR